MSHVGQEASVNKRHYFKQWLICMSELHFPAGVEGVLSISIIDFEYEFYLTKTMVTHDKIMHILPL